MSKRNIYDCYKKYKVPGRASISKQVNCEEREYKPVYSKEEVTFTPPDPDSVVLEEG